jgi:hypothetical protein
VSCASPTPTRSSHMTSAYTLLRRLQLTKPFTHPRALLFDNCCGYRRGGTACRLGTISTSTVPFSGMENLSRHELTRNTKEFDHERLLVTVILGSLSELHWPFGYENSGVVQKLHRSTQIFISLSMVENVCLIHPWNQWNDLWNKDCPCRTGEASHRTDWSLLIKKHWPRRKTLWIVFEKERCVVCKKA